jgi:hypothetical protein
MTCKECVHYEVYNDLVFGGGISNSDTKGCRHFKPKSRFVELPCEVGQEFYWINFVSKEIETDRVIAINIYEDGFTITTKTISSGSKAICTYGENRFKQIMFLSREAAEKALKEREKE